jgi:hypothetical protein
VRSVERGIDIILYQIVTQTSTVSASTLTFTSTPTQVVPTTIVIQNQPIVPVTKQLVTRCDPNQVDSIRVAGWNFNQYTLQQRAELDEKTDQETCCSAAASIPGAFAYAWSPDVGDVNKGGYCEAGFQLDIDALDGFCGESISPFVDIDTIAVKNYNTVGLLQCGQYFTPNSVTNYNSRK